MNPSYSNPALENIRNICSISIGEMARPSGHTPICPCTNNHLCSCLYHYLQCRNTKARVLTSFPCFFFFLKKSKKVRKKERKTTHVISPAGIIIAANEWIPSRNRRTRRGGKSHREEGKNNREFHFE